MLKQHARQAASVNMNRKDRSVHTAMGPRRSLGATLQVIVTQYLLIYIMPINSNIGLTERVYMRMWCGLASLSICIHTFEHALPYI